MSEGPKNLVAMPNGDLVPTEVLARLPDAEEEFKRTENRGGSSRPFFIQYAPVEELRPIGEEPTPYGGRVTTYEFRLTLTADGSREVVYWRYAGSSEKNHPNVGTNHLVL